jgi:ribosomal protein S18 acetylase RimI-like enzyme
MPKVRRAGLPPALLRHLLQRIQERSVGPEQLTLLAA